jgi:hypothetical protein
MGSRQQGGFDWKHNLESIIWWVSVSGVGVQKHKFILNEEEEEEEGKREKTTTLRQEDLIFSKERQIAWEVF